MIRLNKELLEKMPNISIKGFQVGVVGPDPISHWTIRVKVEDVEQGNDFIDHFKRVMRAQEEYWSIKLSKKSRSKMSSTQYAVIEHVGRPPNVEYYVKVILAPRVLINEAINAKNKIYTFLRREGLVLPSRPESIYIISKNKVSKLGQVYREANKRIEEINNMYKKFYKFMKVHINSMFKKHSIDGELSDEPRLLHRIFVTITPVNIGKHEITRWMSSDPTVAEMLYSSVKQFVTLALEDISRRVKSIIETFYSSKRFNVVEALKKLDELEKLASDIGLSEVAKQFLDDIRKELRNPYMFREKLKTLNLQEFLESTKARVLSMW